MAKDDWQDILSGRNAEIEKAKIERQQRFTEIFERLHVGEVVDFIKDNANSGIKGEAELNPENEVLYDKLQSFLPEFLRGRRFVSELTASRIRLGVSVGETIFPIFGVSIYDRIVGVEDVLPIFEGPYLVFNRPIYGYTPRQLNYIGSYFRHKPVVDIKEPKDTLNTLIDYIYKPIDLDNGYVTLDSFVPTTNS